MRNVERAVLADRIRELILGRILDGTLSPGARVVETRIAREVGTSQGPVREALRDLATLGIVDIEPYRGATVRAPSSTEVLDALAVRAELEALAARLAATLCDGPCLRGLERLSRACNSNEDSSDRERSRMESEFRGAVVDAARSRALRRTWRMVDPLTRGVSSPSSDVSSRVLAAIAARDPDTAADAMREFASATRRRLMGPMPPRA